MDEDNGRDLFNVSVPLSARRVRCGSHMLSSGERSCTETVHTGYCLRQHSGELSREDAEAAVKMASLVLCLAVADPLWPLSDGLEL